MYHPLITRSPHGGLWPSQSGMLPSICSGGRCVQAKQIGSSELDFSTGVVTERSAWRGGICQPLSQRPVSHRSNDSFWPGEMLYAMGSTERRTIRDLTGANRIDDPQDTISVAAALTLTTDPAIVMVGLTGEAVMDGYHEKSM